MGFLEKTLEIYPTGKIVMILDNARIHHAKMLEDLLEKNKRLTLMFLPPYSPKLNLIEGLWGWLKNEVINNAFFSKVDEIQQAVRWFINYVNELPNMVIDRLCVKM